MRRWIQAFRHSQIGIYVQCFVLLLLVAGALMVVMGLQCQTRGCSPYPDRARSGQDLPLAYRATMTTQDSLVDVWIEFGETGTFSPTTTAEGTVITTDDGQTISFLNDLATKGYIAIRVPHAPPTYTTSLLRPGNVGESNAVRFSYYSPPGAASRTTVVVSVTRRLDLESIVNAQYPIADGQSHWEVWWLPPGEKFPIPDQPFRLQADDWPPPLALAFQIDFVDALGDVCDGCPMDVLANTGYVFVGPYKSALRFGNVGGDPLVAFGVHCGYNLEELTPTVGQYISPTVPFTQVFCLENWEAGWSRTFTIDATSSQGWNYTYYYQATDGSAPVPAGSPPFVVTVDPPPDTWEPGMLGLLAVHTPAIAVTDTLRETLTVTATSTVSPEVRASIVSFALAPGYTLNESAIEYDHFLYLPLAFRSYQ